MGLAGREVMTRMGLREADLLVPAIKVSVANNAGLRMLGAVFAMFSGARGASARQMLYFAEGIDDFYLSKTACRELGAIPEAFPEVGGTRKGVVCSTRRRSSSTPPPLTSAGMGQCEGILGSPSSPTGNPSVVVSSVTNDYLPMCDLGDVFGAGGTQVTVAASQEKEEFKVDSKGRKLAPCGCLLRTLPPVRPKEMPLEPSVENVQKLQAWLPEYYAASTFNMCEHRPLPMMRGVPAMRIHIKEGAVPVAVHRPAAIPAHWQQKVKEDIERDIRLGGLDRVPENTPMTWCSRMHVVSKKNGNPRRMVDLRPVNAAAERQTHYVEPPFEQARGILAGSWRFTSDAWNGYHSVPLDKRDRHVTTFITPWGRLRYKGGPQGQVVTGDAFNSWYD